MDNGGRVAFIYISHVITDHSWPMTQQWEDHHYCAALTVFSKQKQPILWVFFFFFTEVSRGSENHQIYPVITSVCEEVGEATKLELQDGGRLLEQAEE